MNNYDFVKKYAFSEENKKHWNLFVENSVMYSYGKHYPLLFEVNWLRFVNNRWYSNSTSKHIWYVRSEAQYCVKLLWTDISYDWVMKSLISEKDRIENEISKCIRAVSFKKENLIRQLYEINSVVLALSKTK